MNPIQLRDDLPRYPPLIQFVRVTSATVTSPPGVTLYAAFVQQMKDDGTLGERDREACYVDDVNGAGLPPGYYICRLSGQYNGVPVYVTGALATGSFSPSSFRIYVNEVLEPLESALDLKQATDGHLTIVGADFAGSYTRATFDCLPDGGTYVFNSDTFTWNTSVINFNTSVVNFVTTVINVITASTFIIDNTSVFVIAGYTAQTPSRIEVGSSPPDPLDSGSVQFIMLQAAVGGMTFNGIKAPTFGGGIDGAFLEIYNDTGFTATFKNESSSGGGGTAGNRIVTPNGCDWFLLDKETLFLKYDATRHRWLVLWEPPHYRVDSLTADPPYYYQSINFVHGCGITLTPTTDATNNQLKVTIQGDGVTEDRVVVVDVTFDPDTCTMGATKKTLHFICGSYQGAT